MTEDELNALRTMLREEVNAAIYASEQRTGERLDRIEQRLDGVDTRLNKLEGAVEPMAGHLRFLTAGQREMKGDLEIVKFKQEETIQVLNLAITSFNDLRTHQYDLEDKQFDFEKMSNEFRRQLEEDRISSQRYNKEMSEKLERIRALLLSHERTPIRETHPESG